MPKSLDYIHEELVRVSEELGIEDPRSSSFTRSKFLKSDTTVTKYDLEKYGGFVKLRNHAAHIFGVPNHKIQPESRGVDLANNYVRKLERKVATSDYFAQKVNKHIEKIFKENKIKFPAKTRAVSSKTSDPRLLTLLLSDLHFGVDVKDYEVYGNKFSWNIAARRMAKVCEDAVQWDTDLGYYTLRIILNGDIMQGVIHLNDANIKPMTEQLWGATSILLNAIYFLHEHFPHIEIVCLPGNHDRMTYRSFSRNTTQRWDSHSHSIYLALRLALEGVDRVDISIPTSGIAFMDDWNEGYMVASHGDTEPDPKNVSKKIDTEGLAIKFMQMREVHDLDKPISVGLFGHWHTPTVQMLPNGSVVVVNGSLIGAELFGQNAVGVWGSQPAQVMFESTDSIPFSKYYISKVASADGNSKYDEIIPTPKIIENGELEL